MSQRADFRSFCSFDDFVHWIFPLFCFVYSILRSFDLFVLDGILSVADCNSTWMGVVVVLPVVVKPFQNGVTLERFELTS